MKPALMFTGNPGEYQGVRKINDRIMCSDARSRHLKHFLARILTRVRSEEV